MYTLGWHLTFTTSATVYYAITVFVKPQILPTDRESTPYRRDWLPNEGREGFYEEEINAEEICAPAKSPTTDAEDIQVGEKTYKSDV